MRTWGVAAVLLLSLYACGDDSGDDDDNATDSGLDGGRDGGGGGDAGHDGSIDGGGGGNIDAGTEAGLEKFSELYEEIFMTRCGSCHSSVDGGRRSGNLALVPKDVAHMELVGKPAAGGPCADAGFTRVVPNQPNMSLLLLKLLPDDAGPRCGSRMPRAAPDASANYLSDPQIERVRRWIQQGANNN